MSRSVRHTYERHDDSQTHQREESDTRVETPTEGPRHTPKQLPSVQHTRPNTTERSHRSLKNEVWRTARETRV